MHDILDEFRAFAAPVWTLYERHPWIEALAEGTLTTAQFVRFQIEDRAHVVDYNRVLALGIARAGPAEPWADTAAAILSGQSTGQELAEKEALIAELGGTSDQVPDRWSCSPAREGYVNHLVRTAHEGDLLDIATALYPCSLFTQVIGARLRDVDVPGPEPFGRWAAVYTRSTRTQMCSQHARVIVEAAGSIAPARRAVLARIYRRSLEHQVRVFDAAFTGEDGWPGSERPLDQKPCTSARHSTG
ncbi:TenA family protein [Streptomyces sp. NPDC050658]|uniref:TenA family protein n=1 Tax=unclassified Streptomyces TaxID=2593676 RepID=UPI0034420935